MTDPPPHPEAGDHPRALGSDPSTPLRHHATTPAHAYGQAAPNSAPQHDPITLPSAQENHRPPPWCAPHAAPLGEPPRSAPTAGDPHPEPVAERRLQPHPLTLPPTQEDHPPAPVGGFRHAAPGDAAPSRALGPPSLCMERRATTTPRRWASKPQIAPVGGRPPLEPGQAIPEPKTQHAPLMSRLSGRALHTAPVHATFPLRRQRAPRRPHLQTRDASNRALRRRTPERDHPSAPSAGTRQASPSHTKPWANTAHRQWAALPPTTPGRRQSPTPDSARPLRPPPAAGGTPANRSPRDRPAPAP